MVEKKRFQIVTNGSKEGLLEQSFRQSGGAYEPNRNNEIRKL